MPEANSGFEYHRAARIHRFAFPTLAVWFLMLAGSLCSMGDEASPLVRYSGKLTLNEAPIEGRMEFKFALVNKADSIVWNSDASQSSASAVPQKSVTLTVSNGIYAIVLGDSSIMPPLETALVPQLTDLRLRIWVKGEHTGWWQQLEPDESLKVTAGQVEEFQRATGTRLLQEILTEMRQLRLQLSQLRANPHQGGEPSPPQKILLPLPDDNGQFLGRPDAPVVMVEFTDAECFYCKRFFTTTFPQLKTKYIDTGKVRFISRSFPLDTHNNARDAAKAAFCAGRLKKFWQMRDELFRNNDKLGAGYYEILAKELGLDLSGFEACFRSSEAADAVNRDLVAGESAGVSGTPSFIIGRMTLDGKVLGELMVGDRPEEFETRLVALLAEPTTKP